MSPSSSSSSPSLLPKELWETVLSYLSHHDHEATSLSSRNFLSITNKLFTSLTISNQALPFLSALLLRFPNLTSIKLAPSISFPTNILLTTIASFHLPLLHSLDLTRESSSLEHQHGFSGFHGKFPYLKSLNCFHMGELSRDDLLLIPRAFPNLEELDLSFVTLVHTLAHTFTFLT
ncbi:hypothetical protein PIB30_012091 [Stylosanthes scabra]|uniref:F-box domain-containing protein n=1 Tax=Stylosanthes scabra TaxID=79078 RepID=A0ABU6R6R6_9FABA|nr:hypothetical protein [Stylosanthes scabra]